MKNCTYILHSYDGSTKTFNNEYALNEYISNNIESYINENGDIVYSILDDSRVNSFLNKVQNEKQRNTLKKLTDLTKKRDWKETIGVSRVVESFNSNSEYNYFDRIRQIYESNPNLDSSEVTKKIIQEISASHTGSFIHSIYEIVGNLIYELSSKGEKITVDNLLKFEKDLTSAVTSSLASINEKIGKDGLTTKQTIREEDSKNSKLLATIKTINENLKHGLKVDSDTIKYSIETVTNDLVDFLSKNGHIDQDGTLKSLMFLEQKIVSDVLKLKGKNVTGILDMMLIREDGSVDIIDYKTSTKAPSEWHSKKEYDIAFQQKLYAKILKTNGIDNINGFIIPITYSAEVDNSYNLNNIKLTEDSRTPINVNNLAEDNQLIIDTTIETLVPSEFKNFLNPELNKKRETFIDKYFPAIRNREKRAKENAEYYLEKFGVDNEDGTWTFNYKNKKGEEDEATLPLPEAIDFIAKNVTDLKGVFRAGRTAKIKEAIIDYKNGKMSLERLEGLALTEQNSGMFSKHFIRQYVTNPRYELLDTPDLNDQGILLFQDKLSDSNSTSLEVVVISDLAVNTIQKMRGKNNLLGNARSNIWFKQDRGTLLASTNGNIEAIVSLHLMANKPELFGEGTNFKLNKVTVANILASEYSVVPINPLIENYKQLRKDLNGDVFEDIPEKLNLQKQTVQEQFNAIVRYLSPEVIMDLTPSKKKGESLLKQIKEIKETRQSFSDIQNIRKLILAIKENIPDLQYRSKLFDNEVSNLLLDLEMTYLEDTYGLEDQTIDALNSAISFKNGGLTSLWLDSPSNIHDPHLGAIHRLIQRSKINIQKKYAPFSFTQNKKNLELLEKCGYSSTERRLEGNETKYFNKIIRKNSDGSLDNGFKIKFIDDIADENYKQLALYYLEKFYIANRKLTIKNYVYDSAEKERFKNQLKNKNSFVYDIPLLLKDRGKLSETPENVKNTVRKTAGFFKDVYELAFNKNAENEFDSETDQELYQQRANKRNINTVYNAFKNMALNPAERRKYLSRKGAESFETNLNTVLLSQSFDTIKEEEFGKILSDIYMISDVLVLSTLGKNMYADGLYKYVDQLLNLTVFDKTEYKSAEEKKTQRILNTMKSAASRVLFTFNPMSYMRDISDGFWKGFLETAGKYGYDELKLDNYMKALQVMATQFDLKTVEKIQILNALTGMTNMDTNQIVSRTKSEKTGMQAIWSRYAMSSITAGDYGNRMTFLIAYLMQDGIWDAISYDVDTGVLKYDITKDARFSKLFSDSDTTSEEYLKQKALLNAIIEQKNKENPEKQYTYFNVINGIQTLDFPYTNSEISNIKHMSDLMYGFYDRSERMKVNGSFFGSMMMQFSTYLSAGFARYFQPATVSKIQGKFVHQTNEKGEKLYKHYIDEENDEYEITTEAEGNEPLMAWEGAYLEGILASVLSLYSDLRDGGISEMWRSLNSPENKIAKKNMARLLRDLLLTLLFAGIIKTLYNTHISGNESIPDIFKVPLYAVAYGASNSAKDMLFIRDAANRLGFGDDDFSKMSILPSSKSIYNMVSSVNYVIRPDFDKFVNSWWNASKIMTNPDKKIY